MSTRNFQVKASSPALPSRPSDWLDISSVNDNEINLLVPDGCSIAFKVTTSSGSYSIDWGDGTIESSRASNTAYSHSFALGIGTICSLGYRTLKIRIYGASGDITSFKIQPNPNNAQSQYCHLLWAVFGTTKITDFSNAFYASGTITCSCISLREVTIPSFEYCSSTSSMFYDCISLVKVNLPSSWGAVTTTATMFSSCRSLRDIELPESFGNVASTQNMFTNCYCLSSISFSSWGLVTNASTMFSYCYSLFSVTLPSSWGSVTTLTSMFSTCYSLPFITLPSSWGSVTITCYMFANCMALETVSMPSDFANISDITYMFQSCSSLKSLPAFTSWGNITSLSRTFNECRSLIKLTFPATSNNIIDCQYAFSNCYSLKEIVNLEYLGSTTATVNFGGNSFVVLYQYSVPLIFNAKIFRLQIEGISTYPSKISSVRLLNSSSPFTGINPQVSVQYLGLSADALNQLFTDLPILTGKYINITGCPGAATCTRSIATAKGWTVTG